MIPPPILMSPVTLIVMLGVFGVITFVKKKLPLVTFKFPKMLSVKLAKLVNRKEPEFVAKTLKFPAIVAPFKPPNRFKAAV